MKYPVHDAFHKYFAKLGEIYKKTPTLYEKEYDWQSFQWIDADNADENMFTYKRVSEDREYIIILNFSPNTYKAHTFGVGYAGTYNEIINTESDVFGGAITEKQKVKSVKCECNKQPFTITVNVPPFGGIMLEHKVTKTKKKTTK